MYSKIVPQQNLYINLVTPAAKNNPLLSLSTVYNHNDSSSQFKTGLLKIDIPQEKIAPGVYELTLSRDGGKGTSKQQFEVIWEDMPLKPLYSRICRRHDVLYIN